MPPRPRSPRPGPAAARRCPTGRRTRPRRPGGLSCTYIIIAIISVINIVIIMIIIIIIIIISIIIIMIIISSINIISWYD